MLSSVPTSCGQRDKYKCRLAPDPFPASRRGALRKRGWRRETTKRGGKRWNLTSIINRQIADEMNIPRSAEKPKPRESARINSLQAIARRVSSKIEEGDYKGAIRLACSQDTFATPSDETVEALRCKHPAAHPHSSPPTTPDGSSCLQASPDEVTQALQSFPKGSAAGLDLLRPQHLKDMTGKSAGEGGARLRQVLTSFVNLC